jgi:hypothetical protein
MKLNLEQVRTLIELQGLNVPEDELQNIAIRLSTWLTAMEQIEGEIGHLINQEEPIPPISTQFD